ncbi:MAG: hypothetical protein GWP10_06745 [Nitrospiraceae bacterium]|nr:hypothetical protein [Nitrospiraceae bacterium]
MFRKSLLILSVALASCGTAQVVKKNATPLVSMKQMLKVPKISVPSIPAGSYVPARFIRVYRCSYTDDSGNVQKGTFVWVKVRNERVQASF